MSCDHKVSMLKSIKVLNSVCVLSVFILTLQTFVECLAYTTVVSVIFRAENYPCDF